MPKDVREKIEGRYVKSKERGKGWRRVSIIGSKDGGENNARRRVLYMWKDLYDLDVAVKQYETVVEGSYLLSDMTERSFKLPETEKAYTIKVPITKGRIRGPPLGDNEGYVGLPYVGNKNVRYALLDFRVLNQEVDETIRKFVTKWFIPVLGSKTYEGMKAKAEELLAKEKLLEPPLSQPADKEVAQLEAETFQENLTADADVEIRKTNEPALAAEQPPQAAPLSTEQKRKIIESYARPAFPKDLAYDKYYEAAGRLKQLRERLTEGGQLDDSAKSRLEEIEKTSELLDSAFHDYVVSGEGVGSLKSFYEELDALNLKLKD